MKKTVLNITKFIVSLLVAVLFFSMGKLSADAAGKTYTVTFRPGNVGTFTDNAVELYANYDYEITAHGAIKVSVPSGAAFPSAPTAQYVNVKDGYVVLNSANWGPQAGDVVTKNTDFVVDYGRLIDGVEYSVKYVDEETGESVSTLMVTRGNIGESVSVTAPETIKISDNTNFVLVSNTTQTIMLEADSSKNVIEFKYAKQAVETNVEEVIEFTPGEVVEIHETVQGTTTIIEAEPTPLAENTPAANPEGENEQQGGEGEETQEVNEEGQQEVIIDDEDTALAGTIPSSEDESQSGEVEIEDEEAPLAPGVAQPVNPLFIVLAVVAAVAAFEAGFVWYRRGKKKSSDSEDK